MGDLIAWTFEHQWFMNLLVFWNLLVLTPAAYFIGRAHGRRAALKDIRTATWRVMVNDSPKGETSVR